jgi:hypothetical protein
MNFYILSYKTFEIVHNLQGKQKSMVWKANLIGSNKM